jgi:opacity protein-like surface antigen
MVTMKRLLLIIVLLVCVLALACAPAALAKSQPVAASGSWTWVGGEGGTDRVLSSGHLFLKGYEIGQWSGTFVATDTYENYVGTVLFDPADPDTWYSLRAKLWIHFEDATVDMGGGVLLRGDMTMLVIFTGYDWMQGATWKIHNGTGGLRHLGGEGTLVWTPTGMDYTGAIWTQK